jgi:hypothetical protein
MKIDLKGILEGTYNKIVATEWVEEAAQQRIAICVDCEWFSRNRAEKNPARPDDHCTDCGCNLALKTRCMSCECPLKKWEAIMNKDDWETLKLKLNGSS